MDGVYALQLKHIEQNHNHERADDLYRRMPKQRNLAIQDSRQFLQRVANVKADTKLLQFEVSKSNTEKYQVKRKDINNFNAKNKQAVGITDLEKVVAELRKVDGAAVKIVHNNQNELQGIFFQDQRMKKYFDIYPEILLFDATYSLNDRHMALV